MLMDKHSMKIQDSKLLGPGTFTIDRLVGILKSMYKLEGDYEDDFDFTDDDDESTHVANDLDDYLRCKIHSQETYQLIKTFTSMSIFSPGTADSSNGSMHGEHYRLQCNLKEQAAHKIAKTLGINLADYLLYV